MRTTRTALVLALMLLPSAALAHPGGASAHGVLSGLAHPFGGLDHVLAMVGIGLFAAQRGGPALWGVPAGFLAAMAAGAVAGAYGLPLPGIETAIALSVAIVGALIALRLSLPAAAATGLAALFALLHGHAHGAEMPAAIAGTIYATGFLTATALLLAAGMGLGLLVDRHRAVVGPSAYRLIGSLTALAGLGLLAAAL